MDVAAGIGRGVRDYQGKSIAVRILDQSTESSPCWLGITLEEGQRLGELEGLLKKVKTTSFRLLIVLPSPNNIAQDCLFFPARVCLSSPSSLVNLLGHTSNMSPFRPFFHSSARSKRSNGIRLIIFHFAVRNRMKDVDDVELRMALTLLKVREECT